MRIGTADAEAQGVSDAVERYGDTDAANAGDERLFVEFRKEWTTHPNETKSAAAGRPVFDEVEYIRIHVPGDRNNIVDCPVNEFHRRRFSARYKSWRENMGDEAKQAMSGTPIEKWPELTRGDAEAMRYLHIYTVEQLCGLDDNILTKHPGLRTMQSRAKQWMDVATKGAAASQLRAEKEAAQQESAALRNQLAEQNRRLQQLEERLISGKAK